MGIPLGLNPKDTRLGKCRRDQVTNMGTHTAPFIGKNWVAYLPSQDKECEEEDEEGGSSHQFGLLQHPWPEEAMNQGYLLSCPFTIASPCP